MSSITIQENPTWLQTLYVRKVEIKPAKWNEELQNFNSEILARGILQLATMTMQPTLRERIVQQQKSEKYYLWTKENQEKEKSIQSEFSTECILTYSEM